MAYTVELSELPGLTLLFKEKIGPYWELMDSLFPEMFSWAEENPELAEKKVVGIYYDDPAQVDHEKCRAVMGVLLKKDAPVPEGFQKMEIKPMSSVKVLFHGALHDAKKVKAYRAGRLWFEQSGEYEYSTGEPTIEIYLDNPAKVAESELRTEIYFPLRNK